MTVRQYLLDGPLGFGSAPLGNMFRAIPDDLGPGHGPSGLGPRHPVFRHGTLLRRRVG